MRLAVAIAVMLASGSAVASAEDYNVLELRARAAPAPGDARARQFVHEFGMCIAEDRDAANVLGEIPASDHSNDALFMLAEGQTGCVELNDRLRYAPRFLRGPIAEYWFKKHFSGEAEARRLIAVYPEPSNEELDRLSPDEKSGVIMIDVAQCVAKGNPSGTTALFDTEVSSAAETEAFAALAPVLSGCVPPGVQLQFGKFQLRGFLAEGAYRVAAAARAAATQGAVQ